MDDIDLDEPALPARPAPVTLYSPRPATASTRKAARRFSGSSAIRRGRAARSPGPGRGAPPEPRSPHSILADLRREHDAVHQVPLPQPVYLTRTEQAASSGPSVASLSAKAIAVPSVAPNAAAAVVGGSRVSRETQVAAFTAAESRPRADRLSPSDSLSNPAAATASCTTLRSNGVIGLARKRFPRVPNSAASSREGLESLPVCAVPADVQHQPAALAGLAEHSEPCQLLQRIQHLALAPDQLLELGSHDRHDGAVVLDVHVEVAVEVGDVQQAFEVVGGDVALLARRSRALRPGCSRRRGPPRRRCSVSTGRLLARSLTYVAPDRLVVRAVRVRGGGRS